MKGGEGDCAAGAAGGPASPTEPPGLLGWPQNMAAACPQVGVPENKAGSRCSLSPASGPPTVIPKASCCAQLHVAQIPEARIMRGHLGSYLGE